MTIMTPATISRKQREIAAREQLMLDAARGILVEGGYLGLSMDRVAEATEYAKGTVYLHFASKEDLIAALTIETANIRASMFERAAAFDGLSRERMTAVGVADQLFVDLNPDHFRTEQICSMDSITEKVSAERLAAMHQAGDRCMAVMATIVKDAVAAGELKTSDAISPMQMVYGLWTMAVGHHTIRQQAADQTWLADVDLQAAVWANYHTLLDGCGWTPCLKDWDYDAVIQRINQDVFPDERAAQLNMTLTKQKPDSERDGAERDSSSDNAAAPATATGDRKYAT